MLLPEPKESDKLYVKRLDCNGNIRMKCIGYQWPREGLWDAVYLIGDSLKREIEFLYFIRMRDLDMLHSDKTVTRKLGEFMGDAPFLPYRSIHDFLQILGARYARIEKARERRMEYYFKEKGRYRKANDWELQFGPASGIMAKYSSPGMSGYTVLMNERGHRLLDSNSCSMFLLLEMFSRANLPFSEYSKWDWMGENR